MRPLPSQVHGPYHPVLGQALFNRDCSEFALLARDSGGRLEQGCSDGTGQFGAGGPTDSGVEDRRFSLTTDKSITSQKIHVLSERLSCGK